MLEMVGSFVEIDVLTERVTSKKVVSSEYTYQDYLDLPDDGQRYEIIEGVLYMSNAPNIDHQFAVSEIHGELRQFVKAHKLGYVLTAPFEVHLAEKTRPVQPDVLFIKTERWPGAGAKFFEGAPDLVVEVLSPSTAHVDKHIKFDAYEKAGIPEYWLVNPKTCSVEVWTLARGEYAILGEFVGEELISSAILPGLAIKTHSLFNR